MNCRDARSTRNCLRSTWNSLLINGEQYSVLPGLQPRRGVPIPSSVVAVTGVMVLSDQDKITAEANPIDGWQLWMLLVQNEQNRVVDK